LVKGIAKLAPKWALSLTVAMIVNGGCARYPGNLKSTSFCEETPSSSAYDFLESNSGKGIILYDIEPNLSERPQNFELKRLFVLGEEHTSEEFAQWKDYDKRIHYLISRLYLAEKASK